jgi:hypothetical protein
MAGLLLRWRGTDECGKVGSTTLFDNGDDTLVVDNGGEGFIQLEGFTEG